MTVPLATLIGTPRGCVEYQLGLHGLRNAVGDGVLQPVVVYGCGTFVAGYDYHELLQAHAQGAFLGAIGLSVEEASLAAFSGDIRSRLGWFLKLAPRVLCNDEQSASWMLHYGIESKVGGHPGWLVAQGDAYKMFSGGGIVDVEVDLEVAEAALVTRVPSASMLLRRESRPVAVVAHDDLGLAMLAAVARVPCLLYGSYQFNSGFHRQRHLLARFAARWGCEVALVMTEEEWLPKLQLLLRGDIPLLLSDAAVARASEEAQRTMDDLLNTPLTVGSTDVDAVVQSVFGNGPPPGKPRRIELGTVFNPGMHYSPEYYGEGAGLVYTRPSGKDDVYHGPAHEWEGFNATAEILAELLPAAKYGRRLLSIGCGSGSDVKHFLRRGWDAYGVDLSSAAIARCAPEVRGRLLCADLLDRNAFSRLARQRFDQILALDFWEHIWMQDLESLIRRCHELLEPGGILLNIICTHGKGEREFVAEPGVCFTKENSEILVSGHVTVKTWKWWMAVFRRLGFIPRLDVAYTFQVRRTEDTSFRSALSWGARNLVVVERPRVAV